MVGFTFNANHASSTFMWLLLSFSILTQSSSAFKIQKEDVSRPSKRLMSFQNGQQNSNWFTSSPSWFKEDPKFTLADGNSQTNDEQRSFLKDVLSIKNFFKDPRNSHFQMVNRNSHLKSTSTFKSWSKFSSDSGGTLKKRDPSFSYIITKPSTSQLNSFSTSTYSLVESISGPEFFSHFDFFTGPDPTHGMVSYQTEAEATTKNLAFIDGSGDAVLRVENTSVLQQGVNRDSVRVESKNSYSEGIILIDVKAMPFSLSKCSGVWPAFWTYGKSTGWPAGGEIDIIESIEDSLFDQSTLHSANGCQITPSSPSNYFTGSVLATNCYAYANQNSGCGIKSNTQGSYGSTLSANGGGVFVLKFDNIDGATLWFFPRGSIPQDLNIKTPLSPRTVDPSSNEWGMPYARFSNQNCDFDTFIKNQTIVINTTLMGDWAGSSFDRSVQTGACSGTQADAVAQPSNYDDAYWKISGIEVWQSKK